MLYHFKEVAEVLADKSVVLCQLVAHGPERAATGHFVSLLQLEVSLKPLFQILPRIDFVVDGSGAVLNGCQVALQHLVDQALFALEVVIELAFPGGGSLNDFIRAGSANSLLMEQIGGNPNNSEFCFCTFRVLGFRFASLNLYYPVK